MNLREAVRIAFNTGSGRKLEEGEIDHTAEVDWPHAWTGVVVLAVVQIALLIWSSGNYGADVLRDLGIVAFAALAIPFVVFWLVSRKNGTLDRLPAAFLYLSLILAGLQILSAVLSTFGAGSSGFLVGLLGAIVFISARNFLKIGWQGAILIGILVVVGFMGSGFLLYLLPSGKLFV